MVARRGSPELVASAAADVGPLPRPLVLLLLALGAAAVAVLVVAGVGAPPVDPAWGPLLLLAGCTLVADLIPVVETRSGYGHLTTAPPFVVALLAVAGPTVGLPVVAAAALTAQTLPHLAPGRRRRPVPLLAWSPSTRVVAAATAAAVLGWSTAGDLGRVGVAAAAYAAVMVVLTVAAAAADTRRPARTMLLDDGRLVAVLLVAVLLALSPVIALVADQAAALIPTLLIPPALVWRSRQQERARQRSLTVDRVTGLPTRPGFVTDAQALFDRPGTGAPAVLMVDLDRFRDIETVLGEDAAEQVLRAAAGHLREVGGDLPLGSLGGDRFAVAMIAQPFAPAHHLAQQIRAALAAPVNVEGVELRLSAVIGIAQGDGTVDTLLRRASVASMRAASSGDQLAIHRVEEPAALRRRFEVLAALSAAIESPQAHGLGARFQPIVDGQGYVSSAEALARWDDPVLGTVPPDEFIPLAEQTGMVRPLFDTIVTEALRGCRRWRDGGLATGVSVNLSPHNLREPLLVSSLRQRLADVGLPPDALTVEVTETAVMQDTALSRRVLQEIRTIGCGIALDDFGVGYSSLARLRDLPVDQVKLDRSFVDRLLEDARVRAIVTATIDVCRALGLRVVAEGVETDAQADALIELGVDRLQGFLFAPALTVEELIGARSVPPAG